jgi:hypothetical protein
VKVNIGEIHDWNGKKFEKQANGKWKEVSEHGKTKEQHRGMSDVDRTLFNAGNNVGDNFSRVKEHQDLSDKLSDKEHTDEEVGLGKKDHKFPEGTMKFVDNENGEESYHVPTGDSHPKHGIKYQRHDKEGKKIGRASYMVDNIKDYGSWGKHRSNNPD